MILLFAEMPSAPAAAQVPPQNQPPSADELEAMQENMMETVRAKFEEVFGDSNTDDNDTLDKDELLEFGVDMIRVRAKAIAGSGMPVAQPS